MLKRLTIENYALIDNSEIEFGNGLTVITGETGAGKSIMLDALSLLMGARADTKSMGDKSRKTVVEAVFSKPDPSLKKLIEDADIEWDEKEIIIRRELSSSGRSRGFINDSPVNLSLLSIVSERLLDIHSQHKNTLLNNPNEQIRILDAFGETSPLLDAYRQTFKSYVELRNRIKKIKEGIDRGKENREFVMFRLEQLDKLKPKKGELSKLEKEAEILGDADNIKTNLTEAGILMAHGSGSVIKNLQTITNLLSNLDLEWLSSTSGDIDLMQRINSVKIELRDIADTVDEFMDKVASDPERLEKIRARIDAIEEAIRRFKVKDESELVEMHIKLREELAMIDGDETDLGPMEGALKKLAISLKKEAKDLSEARKQAGERFSKAIVDKISPLGLPNVRFKVEIEKGKMSADGQDKVEFYCSFNKNHPLQPIGNIASGGEMARVMLGIKSLMAENMQLPTIIFDEIDTGVSGEIAHKMGMLMKEVSDGLQVLSVTHLPQVAAKGHTHLKVYKADDQEKTVSHIKELTPEERVNEIAAMLSGDSINDVALQNAKILLNS